MKPTEQIAQECLDALERDNPEIRAACEEVEWCTSNLPLWGDEDVAAYIALSLYIGAN